MKKKAFWKLSSNLKNLKLLAVNCKCEQKTKDGNFRKRWHQNNHKLCLPKWHSQDKNAVFKFLQCSEVGRHWNHYRSENTITIFKFLWRTVNRWWWWTVILPKLTRFLVCGDEQKGNKVNTTIRGLQIWGSKRESLLPFSLFFLHAPSY